MPQMEFVVKKHNFNSSYNLQLLHSLSHMCIFKTLLHGIALLLCAAEHNVIANQYESACRSVDQITRCVTTMHSDA